MVNDQNELLFRNARTSRAGVVEGWHRKPTHMESRHGRIPCRSRMLPHQEIITVQLGQLSYRAQLGIDQPNVF